MSKYPIPQEAIEFVPKSNADDWRGVKDTPLALHKTPGLLGDFNVLATDGVVSVIRVIGTGLVGVINNSNIVMCKPEKEKKSHSVKTPTAKLIKVPKALKKILSEEQFLELLNS